MRKIIVIFLFVINLNIYGQINNVNVGSSADDGTGDNLRNAFIKVNNNDNYLDAIKLDSNEIKTKISDSLTAARSQLRSDINDTANVLRSELAPPDSTWLYGTFTDSAGITRIVGLDSIKDGITSNWYEISDFLTSSSLLTDSTLYLEAGDGDYFDVQTGIGGKYFDAFIDGAGFGFDNSGIYGYGDDFNFGKAVNYWETTSGITGMRLILNGTPATRKLTLSREDDAGQGVSIVLDTVDNGKFILEINNSDKIISLENSTKFNHHIITDVGIIFNSNDTLTNLFIDTDTLYFNVNGKTFKAVDSANYSGGGITESFNRDSVKQYQLDSFLLKTNSAGIIDFSNFISDDIRFPDGKLITFHEEGSSTDYRNLIELREGTFGGARRVGIDFDFSENELQISTLPTADYRLLSTNTHIVSEDSLLIMHLSDDTLIVVDENLIHNRIRIKQDSGIIFNSNDTLTNLFIDTDTLYFNVNGKTFKAVDSADYSGGGGISSESDPVFTAHLANDITEDDTTRWGEGADFNFGQNNLIPYSAFGIDYNYSSSFQFASNVLETPSISLDGGTDVLTDFHKIVDTLYFVGSSDDTTKAYPKNFDPTDKYNNVTKAQLADSLHNQFDSIVGLEKVESDTASTNAIILNAADTIKDISINNQRLEFQVNQSTFSIDNTVYDTSVTLDATDLDNLGATPVEAVSAPGAGKLVDIISISAYYDYGTITYTAGSAATNGLEILNFSNIGSAIFQTDNRYVTFSGGSNGSGITGHENSAVNITYDGDYDTGDGTLTLNITYKIITL